MKKPLVVLYAFHDHLGQQYKSDQSGGSGIPAEYQTSTRTEYLPGHKRQDIKTYYLGDVKDDPKMQSEIENIYGVKE